MVGNQAGRVQWTKGGLTLGKFLSAIFSNIKKQNTEKNHHRHVLFQIDLNISTKQ